MANDQKRTEVSQLGEFGLIEHLTAPFTTFHKDTIVGVGDDAAVLAYSEKNYQLITTDLLVEGIHFDLMYTPLEHLGYKSVIVNLSDICAMNGIPKQVTVSMAISNRFSVEALEEIYKGIRRACERYKVDLVGGDTSSSQRGLILSVAAIGEVEKDRVVYRSGAKPGDILCVTGDLGAAYLGLQILEREKQLYLNQPDIQPDLQNEQYVIGRQLKPEARLDMIRLFQKNNIVPTSMIDISDGLSSDLHHICKQSDVGAFVEESGVPIHPDAQMLALQFQLDPITCALSGGEDYELLFTIHPSDLPKVRLLPDIYMMGEMTEKQEKIKLHTKGGNIHPIEAQGWNHLKQQSNGN